MNKPYQLNVLLLDDNDAISSANPTSLLDVYKAIVVSEVDMIILRLIEDKAVKSNAVIDESCQYKES